MGQKFYVQTHNLKRVREKHLVPIFILGRISFMAVVRALKYILDEVYERAESTQERMVDDTISIKNMSKIHQLYLCPGSFHQTRICDNPSRSLGIRLAVMQGTDPNPSHVRSSRPYIGY